MIQEAGIGEIASGRRRKEDILAEALEVYKKLFLKANNQVIMVLCMKATINSFFQNWELNSGLWSSRLINSNQPFDVILFLRLGRVCKLRGVG